MEPTEPILDVDLGAHNGVRKFFTVEEIKNFVESEYSEWTWLSSSPVSETLSNPWNTVGNGLGSIRNTASQLTPNDTTRIESVKNSMENIFRSTRIPLSTSPIGIFILELKAQSPVAAAAALASWLKVGGVNISNFDHLKGAVLMAAFDENISPKVPQTVRKSLEKLTRDLQTASAKTEQETREQRNDFSQNKAHQRKITADMVRQGRRRVIAFREHLRQNAETAISSIQQAEALYREHMKIKGPVEYWKTKAAAHRNSANSYRKTLVVFSVVAGLGLIGALAFIASHAIEIASTDKPPAVYLVLVTLGVVLSTVVFWAARILTRLFLSEHHLAIDADERAVMAQTYLALTAEGQATDSERSIVLASLFRPTADGIVKDDAAPDLSPAALLSKIGSR